MKKHTNVVFAFGAAVALAVLPTTPAFADQGAAIIGAQAYYTTGNDQLSVQDTQADGKSAIAELRASSTSQVYVLVNSSGKGTIKYRTVAMPTNYQIRACVQDLSAGGAKSCTAWINGS